MVGQLYLLLYLFYQAEPFPDYRTRRPSLALPNYLHHVAYHVIVLLNFGKSTNWWRIYWSINKRFRCKLKLSTLLRPNGLPGPIADFTYLATFRMIFLDFVFRRYKWSLGQILLKKTTFHPIKFFCEKSDGHSKRETMKIIDLHLKRVFTGWYY